jgi:hypothetical protein
MKIAIDLDNTITADKNSALFFRIITHLLIPENDIIIISNRDKSDWENTEQELDVLGIRYSRLVLTANKAGYVLKNGITIFFENSDEYFLELPQTVTVFKIREEFNFSFAEKKWITSKRNSILID